MRIAHNLSALTAYNSLKNTTGAFQKTVQQLSTGLRVNSAADDAAGLSISEKMRAQTSGLGKAVQNAQDGVSLLQTAEGAIESTQSILQRMRELAVQASNDTLTSQDRAYIQLEMDELRDEVDRIAQTTQFNGKRLLNGSSGTLWSSSDVNTGVLVHGGLGVVDKFGQKTTAEGNYRIAVRADAGQGQVQKSNIFKIKDKNVLVDVKLNKEAGAVKVEGDDLPQGNYTVKQVMSSTTMPSEGQPSELVGMSSITGYYNLEKITVGTQYMRVQSSGTEYPDHIDWNSFLGQKLTFRIGNETLDVQMPTTWEYLTRDYRTKYQYNNNVTDRTPVRITNARLEMRELITDAFMARRGAWVHENVKTMNQEFDYSPILWLGTGNIISMSIDNVPEGTLLEGDNAITKEALIK